MSKITKQASGKPRKIKPLPKEDKSKRYLYPEYDNDMCIKLAGISAAAYRTPKAFVHQLRALDMPYYEYELVEKDNKMPDIKNISIKILCLPTKKFEMLLFSIK